MSGTASSVVNNYNFTASYHPGYVANRWYQPVAYGTVAAGAAIASSSMRMLPFLLSQAITISNLGARLAASTASGGKAQFAIYASDPATKLPTGAALAATGDVAVDAVGVVSAAVGGGNVQLQPGLYWMAININAAAATGAVTFTTLNSTSLHTSLLIGSANETTVANGSTVATFGLTLAQTFGTWPDVTGQTFTEVMSTTFCLVHFKISSVP